VSVAHGGKRGEGAGDALQFGQHGESVKDEAAEHVCFPEQVFRRCTSGELAHSGERL